MTFRLWEIISMPSQNDTDYILSGVNLTDIDDLVSYKSSDVAYATPGTFLHNDAKWKAFAENILDASFRFMGNGSYNNSIQNFISRLDRHGTAYTPVNTLNYGYTFITRPRLNMTTGNLRQHPVMSLLASEDNRSIAFAIRMLLDTCISRGLEPFAYGRYSRNKGMTIDQAKIGKLAAENILIDTHSPFFTPLCNGLRGISGFPDFNIVEATLGEDFHSGDMTIVKGAELFNRTQELSLEFVDIQGSVVLSCFFYWCLYMALQAKNIVMAYPDDIYEQRLNYTVSIYRFITDHTRRNILWWCKATGCFPKSAPIGAIFNINQGEINVAAAKNFSIPFAANCIEYNDPGIIYDFRTLVRRYNPGFDKWKEVVEDSPGLQNQEMNLYLSRPSVYKNFLGLPDIIGTTKDDDKGVGGLRLIWREDPSRTQDDTMDKIKKQITDAAAELQQVQQNNIKAAASKLYKR